MKKILIIFCIIFICTSSYAKSISDDNGNDWNIWDTSMKINYVKGFISASCFVSVNNENITIDWCDPKTAFGKIYCPDVDEQEFDRRKKRENVLKRYCITGISVGQIIDGLNLFYKDFRNRQIRINLAVYVVRKEIEGVTNEEIEEILRFLRKYFKTITYGGVPELKYKDKSGKEHDISFP